METLYVGCEEEVSEPGGVGLAGLAEGRTSEHLGDMCPEWGCGRKLPRVGKGVNSLEVI